ncbi:MAG: LacI family DNA-binding transcriptional regulator [Anaerolineaceae bacterium]|nr:LacI family DNA-binding transcriptional regulator [Anaerolineaceae bacterium]
MTSKRPTIRDVAQLAGVSHQTVSRVINQYDRINPETRKKVDDAIEVLGYHPSAIARSMSYGGTRTFACISPNLTDYTFASMIEGAETYAREHGYFLISATAPDASSFQNLVEQLVQSRRTEGLLVINPYADKRYLYLPKDVPVVLLGARPRTKGLASVALDDKQGGYLATKHLLSLGHKQIALISGPLEEDCVQDRINGYKKALDEAGLPFEKELIYSGDWSATSGQVGVENLIKQGMNFSAIFAQNDRMATGAIHFMQKIDWRIPEDVSIVGFDDMPLSSYFNPSITTIRQDVPILGHNAVRLLINKKENPGEEIQQLLYTPELVVRNSTSEVKKRR